MSLADLVDELSDADPGRAARRLRRAFAQPGLIRVAGAHNALGARLAQQAGFDAVWASGLELSASHTVPDANILTMSDVLLTAQGMANAVAAPVVVDCDTGFGNVNNVIHMVRRFEAAGVAAVCIEDKRFPKVNSFIPGRQELAPIAEFVGKIRAAKSTQRDPDFVVIARVEALIAGWGLDEALERAGAYADAGADAILVHSKARGPEEILRFMERWDGRAPVVVVPTTYFSVTGRELEAAGVKMVIYANHGLRASVRAVQDAFAEILAQDGTREMEARIAPMAEIFELQGMREFREAESRFLRDHEGPTRAVILAAGDHHQEAGLTTLTAETPLSMLDVGGKPLLARQVDVLHAAGIRDIHVVAGYRADQVAVEGAVRVCNAAWDRSGEIASLRSIDAAWEGRTLVAYGDVLFERHVVARLLESRADVALLVDSSFAAEDVPPGRAPDLVVVDGLPRGRRRALAPDAPRRLRRVAGVAPPEANGEFAGLALFSERALAWLNEAGDGWRLTEALQAVIDGGGAVTCVEVASGWMEIRTLEDYRLSCALLSGRP